MFISTPVTMPFSNGGRRPSDHPPGWENMQRKKKKKEQEQKNKKNLWIKKPKKKESK